jgi:hypothetical protein
MDRNVSAIQCKQTSEKDDVILTDRRFRVTSLSLTRAGHYTKI